LRHNIERSIMIDNNDILRCENDAQELFYTPFLKYIEKAIPIDEEITTLVAKHCRLVTFDKGERLFNAGKACKYIYFIVSGECMSYYANLKGKTTTWFFHFNQPESTAKNLFAVDYKSFLSGNPATISIEALSQVTAIRFSAGDVQALIEGSQDMERWLRQLNEKVYIQTYDRITTLLTLSAAERYEKFLATEPHLLNMFSNYLVASYLNVAPQSLSRIRKQMVSAAL